ncbi:MAG: hypothetical protein L3J26_01715 [Candidatus Polarisedimenticolaceae bacterium]|nr:hypothetical protein [Candidatus Polarisedimenticolaceae bacterium]
MTGSRLLLVLIPLYPLALHVGIFAGSVTPGILVLSVLLLLSGGGLLMKQAYSGWVLLLLGVGLLICQAYYQSAAQMTLFLPPILINLLLGFLFARTLGADSTPLISAFAKVVHGHELDEMTRHYTRAVTRLWTGLFVLLALGSLLLALFAPLEIWSLFTNFINYLLVLLIFVIEYQVRIRHLPHLKHPGFIGFMRLLGMIDLRALSKS